MTSDVCLCKIVDEQKDVVKGMKLTQCIVAENGPDSTPESLAQELRSLGQPVTTEIFAVCVCGILKVRIQFRKSEF